MSVLREALTTALETRRAVDALAVYELLLHHASSHHRAEAEQVAAVAERELAELAMPEAQREADILACELALTWLSDDLRARWEAEHDMLTRIASGAGVRHLLRLRLVA